jgi:hypothetical protein
MRRLVIVAVVFCFAVVGCTEDEGASYEFDLAGSNEVCDGDTCGGDGSGSATLAINADRDVICYEISLEGLEGVIASHIHEAPEGESGDPVVDITGLDDDGGEDCVEVEEELLEEILAEPEGY